MRRNEFETVGQAHECALAWADELEDVPNAAAEVTLKFILSILQKFPAEQSQEDDRLDLNQLLAIQSLIQLPKHLQGNVQL